jgi:DNA-binding IclR family transcriptional regulator
MTPGAKPDRQSVRRTLRLIAILAGHSVTGLRLQQIAAALKTSPPNALRDLQVMAEEGWAERLPTDKDLWRLTPKPIQIARAHDLEMQRQRQKIDEIDQRYTREPN